MSQYEEPSVEPSILDYARFHGLSIDYRAIHPLQYIIDTPSLPDVQDPPELFEIDASCGTPAPERLSISKEAAALLSSIRETQPEDYEFDESILPDTHRVRNLKMETPLLRTDPELDLRDFRARVIPDLAAEHLPLEKVDEELDEGLTWPLSYEDLYRQVNEESESEKPMFSKEALIYLQSTLSSHKGHDGFWNLEDSLESSCRRKIVEPLTPTLLPMSPEVLPCVPSSDVDHFELLSDHTSPTRDELCKLDEKILKADFVKPGSLKREATTPPSSETMLLDYEDIGAISTPPKGIEQIPSAPVCKRVRINDYKVDGSLTPLLSEQPSSWKPKSVSFQENLFDTTPGLPPSMGRPENMSSEDIDGIFAETIQPIAEGFDRQCEQEQLQEACATKRVKVPIMDFSRPIAPWNASLNDGKGGTRQRQLIADIKTEHFGNHLWPLSSKAEQALTWVAIPAELARAAVHEEIAETSLLQEFIAKPDCLDFNTLTWKLDGLRILDDTESDTETLQEGDHSDATSFVHLVWKRSLELEEGGKNDSYPFDSANVSAKIMTKDSFCSSDGPLGGSSSGFCSIGSFLNIRNQQYEQRKTTESRHFPSTVVLNEGLPSNPIVMSNAIPVPEPKHQITSPPIPTPKITRSLEARPFVVSSTILAKVRLSTRLRQLYPSAELIERDFARHSTNLSSASKPNTKNITGANDIVGQEADIILSPGVGIIWTTLTKVKQRSLPGQSVQSPIKDRISRCAPRYEDLVMLVSEGLTVDQNTKLDDKDPTRVRDIDYETISELTGFCSSLEGVRVIYVDGGEEQLLQWTVSLMVKHGTKSDVKLLQDETLWELFLRRAGMNAFAAQVVLAELKAPELPYDTWTNVDQGYGEFGLTTFVMMSLPERIERFEHIFGGRRLLYRVSRVIDAHWRS